MNPISAVRNESRSGQASDANGLIRGLGWFGVTAGLAELAVPKTLANIAGLDSRGSAPALVRAMGVRELASGVAVLARAAHPAPGWVRIIGDALDLGLLGFALSSRGSKKHRLAIAIGAIAGIAALDVVAARRSARLRHKAPVIATVTINSPPKMVYEFFRKLDQLPRFMDYLTSVEPIDERRSRWTAKLPTGKTVSWEAEILEDRPGEVVSWQSVAGSTVKTRGRITFTRAPGRDMTEVRIEMYLDVLGSSPITGLARLFAKYQVKGDLRRLKQVIETGEVLFSDASTHRLPHPAQPAEAASQGHAPGFFIENPPATENRVTP